MGGDDGIRAIMVNNRTLLSDFHLFRGKGEAFKALYFLVLSWLP